MTSLIEVRDLKVGFRLGDQVHEAVRGVSFDIPANTTVALVGESGSGKSVSAMSIVRLLPDNAVVDPASRISFEGRDLAKESPEAMRRLRGKEISVVFQEPMSSLNPVMTVGEQIAEAILMHLPVSAREARDRALELLNEVGIPEPRARLDAYPHELSGGQQQRVMIAIAIACEPKLLIADEPTTALDVTVQRQVVDLLAGLQERHRMSMLFISHDLALVGEVARQVIVMRHGVVREAGDAQQLFHAPEDAYTRALLACRPRLDTRPLRLPVIDDIVNNRPLVTEQRVSPPPSGEPLVRVEGLRKAYQLKEGLFKRKVIDAVRGADFDLHKGRTLGVVGESGSGKTTIGMMLTRLTQATGGRILFEGQDLATLAGSALQPYRRRIQIIFQNPYASLNPRFTIGQVLMEPMRIHGIGADDNDRARLALGWLEKVGLPAAAFGKYPHEFSGGQRQRIAIARCLTMQPEIIVCDESVSALDVSVQATVLNLLLDLQQEFGLTYVFISHDLAVVKYMADDILVMNKGEIVERGSAEQIYADPQHPYTKQLLAAIPRGIQHAAAA
ncbi:ABC transporter ATP-binding protein [Ramlibacter algicola]|uniref:ABC transporter ATP-binding protein n=1 Tax=Ramlibacter algicola TaxID=2795217 RepID=A0A934URA2_9BURK|nr:dipeptide ABC transporter ATP-binding protein [Ramlibacter algicola]MBK0392317.1 ABC transporter ATP-binding protein [Ramlibacter algicola]